MRVCAVIVTYGDRFHYVEQVIQALVAQEIDKIILVSNGTSSHTNRLLDLKERCTVPIQILFSEKNRGSAYGFKAGIEKALEDNDIGYIWLLDDDNKPEAGAMEALKGHWLNMLPESQIKEKNYALLSYRYDRPLFKEAVIKHNPRLMLRRKNSFLGFHVRDIFYRLYERSRPLSKYLQEDIFGKVAVAPYGGLFFHRDLIEVIGLPDETYYLYGDDYDFSYRITKGDGAIILVGKSQIRDLETSFHLGKNTGAETRFFKTDSRIRIYYSVRNGVRFERENLITNRGIYMLNMVVYLTLTLLLSSTKPKGFGKFYLILKAVMNGLRGDYTEFKDEF